MKVKLTRKQFKALVNESLKNVIKAKDALRTELKTIYGTGGYIEELDTPYWYRIYVGDYSDSKRLEKLCADCLANVSWKGEGLGYYDMKITDPAAEVIDEIIRDYQDTAPKHDTQDDTTKIVTERSWDDFDKFDDVFGDYLPSTGEGDTMASQIATAVCKLVYKWFNDGDVYDNTASGIESGNDLSSYANWLAEYVPEADVLSEIFDIGFGDFDAQYEEILFHLCENLSGAIAKYADKPKVGSVYNCKGEFNCEDMDEEEEDY